MVLLWFLGLFTFLQILTGIWLTLFYIPTPEEAFSSIEMLMQNVPYGWLFRYLHSTGASAFFIVIYAYIFRSLLYGSYKKPRELVWLLDVSLYIVLLLETFLGYLLPWGQTSYWASEIGTSLFDSIPKFGPMLTLWIRGNNLVSGETLHRFFTFHVIAILLILIFLIRLHLTSLHKVGCNNPEGISLMAKTNKIPTKLPFHPYYSIKELHALLIFLFVFSIVVFFVPDMYGYFLEENNFLPADPLLTPNHRAALVFSSFICRIMRYPK